MRAIPRRHYPPAAVLWLALPLVAHGAAPRQTLAPEAQLTHPATAADPSPVATTADDTLWIADWHFDSGGCTDAAGWTGYDNRVLNDGSNYWSVSASFAGTGSITSNAAVLRKHDLSWARDGYGNNWDYSIVLKYMGASTLSFDFLSDTEWDNDFVQVEVDSAGASEARVDYLTNPGATAADYRTVLVTVDSLQTQGIVSNLALPDFGAPTVVHEVYIRFTSDPVNSDEDAGYPSAFNAGLIVDNVAVTGVLAYTEDFECGDVACLHPNVEFVNSSPSTPFGLWARLWPHPTDNDICTENTTCAWIFSDPSLLAYSPGMAFGPGGAVVRNWLDNVIVSPWVSLSGLPPASGTVLTFRRFPGNNFASGRIVQGWRVRSRVYVDNSDTPTPGDSIEVVTPWAHTTSWNSLSSFTWTTNRYDMSPHVPTGARDLQVSFRTSDWQLVNGATPPATLDPGPGPYLDRVRIGRRAALTGPALGSSLGIGLVDREVAQDGFPSAEIGSCPQIVPTTDRFGACDFSPAFVDPSCMWPVPPCYGLEDSITIYVRDVREAGITGAGIYAAIVAGPHVGKAPPPWSVGANGFFLVPAAPVQPGATHMFLDLDDEYFRGGDRLVYFWWGTDGAGGFTSSPAGLTGIPSSVAEAQQATGGLVEVAFLPRIDWDPAYLARIAADPSGKLTPTPQEIANSRQATSILYVRQRPAPRRHGSAHRSRFMHTLDQLGYGALYDEFYVNFTFSDYRHHLASRMSLEQATGYALIIQDSGDLGYGTIPPGGCERNRPVPQVQWYRDWLAQVSTSAAGMGTLWILGTNVVQDSNPLIADDMGVTLANASQSLLPYPNITGQQAFTWASGDSTDFTGDQITLMSSGCSNVGNDAIGSTGTAVVTHRYALGASVGDGAVVMNANPAASWNSILMAFDWEDLLDPPNSPPGDAQAVLVDKILTAVLPDSIRALVQPTDVHDRASTLPRTTVLRQNMPNPFNPVTTIRFDLARGGPVALRVYDVAGRRVRTLLDASLPAGWNHRVTWDGQDDNGRRVASGIYLYRLSAGDFDRTMKTVILK